MNKKEELIACMIAQGYTVMLEENMFIRAIKTNQMRFLYYVFAYNKNFERVELEGDEDEDSDEEEKFRCFMYDDLFQMIENYCTTKEEQTERVVAIANWRLHCSDNILQSMIKHRHDMEAAEYGHFYINHSNIDPAQLFRQAIEHDNVVFLKYAFKEENEVFDSSILDESFLTDPNDEKSDHVSIQKFLLDRFKNGVHVEMICNVLSYADWNTWGTENI